MVLLRRLWEDRSAQDLIEYALMASVVGLAAGAILPGIVTSLSEIFSKVGSLMTDAASGS